MPRRNYDAEFRVFRPLVGSYALSVLDMNEGRRTAKHYRIKDREDGGCYITLKETFSSLAELVGFYSGTFEPPEILLPFAWTVQA